MITLSSGNKYYSQAEWDIAQRTLTDLRKDMDIIAEALRDEAIERDWCSIFNDFVDKVNAQLSSDRLVKTFREYEVRFNLERKQTAYVYKTISATNEDEAYELADEMYSFEELSEEVSEYGWELEDYDVEITSI